MFPVEGVSQVWQLVLDVRWLNIPREPKLYVELTRELGEVAAENAGVYLVGAAADVLAERVALFFSREHEARQFEADWRNVARRVRAEITAARRTIDMDDISF